MTFSKPGSKREIKAGILGFSVFIQNSLFFQTNLMVFLSAHSDCNNKNTTSVVFFLPYLETKNPNFSSSKVKRLVKL